jgi:hypothetical protein
MFCSGCGQAIEAGQPICAQCGRPVAAVPAGGVTPQYLVPFGYSRVHRHVRTLGILWMAHAAMQVVGWLFAVPLLNGLYYGMGRHWDPFAGVPFGGGFPFGHMPWPLQMIITMVFVRAALSLVTGVGLITHKSWGRTLALVTAFLTLIKPVLGLILAIYTLWVLLPTASGQEYEQIAV